MGNVFHSPGHGIGHRTNVVQLQAKEIAMLEDLAVLKSGPSGEGPCAEKFSRLEWLTV